MAWRLPILIQCVGVFAVVTISTAIWLDAEKLRQKGVRISPFLWFVLCIILFIAAAPIYLVLRIVYFAG